MLDFGSGVGQFNAIFFGGGESGEDWSRLTERHTLDLRVGELDGMVIEPEEPVEGLDEQLD